MGAALKLLIDGPALLYVVPVRRCFRRCSRSSRRYARYVSILKWLCLSLFSYVVCAFVVDVPWAEVALGDHLAAACRSSRTIVIAIVAVLGTTISPYLFFWQAEQEVEDEKEKPRRPAR